MYLNGQPAVRINTGVNDTATATAPENLNPLRKAYRLNPALFAGGVVGTDGARTNIVAIELQSSALPDAPLVCSVRLGAMKAEDRPWNP